MRYSEKNLKELAKEDEIFKYKNVIATGEVKEILEDIGLPNSVAPYIDFYSEEAGGGKCLLDYIDLSQYQECYDNNELKEIENDFKKYIQLGRRNSGDIIAIDYNDEIVAIDHENLNEVYVNIDLDAFLSCIYLYYKFIEDLKSRYEVDVFIEDIAEMQDLDRFKEALLQIDDTSLNEDSFWEVEIIELTEAIEEREESGL